MLDPVNVGPGGAIPNTVTDPDLLAVANSVPGMIGQTFSVSSIHDVAILEFDFIPTSDSLKFRYAFGSQEYFAFENTQYNDVFGFFLSGPGIAGPWTAPAAFPNGSVNLAVVPNTNPPLPITISSICNDPPDIMNPQYFVPNQGTALDTIDDINGFITVLTARALVQCGETYHIRLAIADGSDMILNSYVWLEAGSFSSPLLDIVDNLGIDSAVMNIPCNASIVLTADGGTGATYQWFDSTATLVSTDSFLIAGPGIYWVEASSFGCPVISDTLEIIAEDSPSFDLGLGYTIPCNTTTTLNPVVTGGLGNASYTYAWSNNSTDSSIIVAQGTYHLEVDDGTGCYFRDTITITEDVIPTASISGGGSVCDDGATVDISFTFNGLLPWDLTYTNGISSSSVNDIPTNNYSFPTLIAGQYGIELADDTNDCVADIIGGTVEVIVNPLPVAEITPNDVTIYVGEEIELNTGEYTYYEWFIIGDTSSISSEQLLIVTDSGSFYIVVEDEHGCTDISDTAIVRTTPLTALFIPTIFTPNNDSHNELFVVKGQNIRHFNIQIFTRWGQLIFESNSIDKYWDGFFENKRVPEGTYYYQIEALGEDRNSFTKAGMIQVIY
jgi:gliding motility-associated-like protein